jgi:hypothetical protein
MNPTPRTLPLNYLPSSYLPLTAPPLRALPLRRQPSRALPPLLPLLLAAGALALLSGCSDHGTPSPQAGESSAEAAPAAPTDTADVYEVRGQLVELPDPEDPLSSFIVHHEAIDDFRNMEGEIQGMDSMTMPFPLADDVSLEGVSVGDRVVMDLVVDWEADPVIQVTRVEKLDADTELDFRGARPGEGGSSGESEEGEGPG